MDSIQSYKLYKRRQSAISWRYRYLFFILKWLFTEGSADVKVVYLTWNWRKNSRYNLGYKTLVRRLVYLIHLFSVAHTLLVYAKADQWLSA